jgi:hypothetical protein
MNAIRDACVDTHSMLHVLVSLARRINGVAIDLYELHGDWEKVWPLLDKAERIAFLAGYQYPANPLPELFVLEERLSSIFLFAQHKRKHEDAARSGSDGDINDHGADRLHDVGVWATHGLEYRGNNALQAGEHA